MIENIFDCICSSLLYTPNKKLFLKAQGIELMLIMVKNKKFVRKSALKVCFFFFVLLLFIFFSFLLSHRFSFPSGD
jgi:hypothetical protein